MVRFSLVVLCALALACRSKSAADAGATSVTASAEWMDGRLPTETGSPRDGGTLVIRVMSEPATLNYLDDGSHDGWCGRILMRQVMDSLVEISPTDFSIVPGLASRWADSDDHLITTLTLRSDAVFSNGQALDSADVIATFDVVMDPKRPTGTTRGEFGNLAAWRAIDAKTVELKWKEPSPLSLRAVARLPIFSHKQFEGDWAEIGRAPIGTGPWVVSSWERGTSLTLTRRSGASVPLEKLVFRFVKDHGAAAALFEKGEFDLMTNILPANWRGLEASPWAKQGYNRIRNLDNSYSYMAWNELRPGLADAQVRRALAHLYDSKLIARVVDLELELPTNCPYYRDGDSCSASVTTFAFSPDEARALLTDAGYVDRDGDGVRERDGVKLEFEFLLPATSVRLTKLLPLYQEQLAAAGVSLRVEKVENVSLSARVAKRDFDVVSRVWTEFDREQDLFQNFHSSQRDGGANFAGYSNEEADRLIEQIRGEFDVSKRRALERRLHERLYADQPYLFMTARQSLDAAKRRVHGLQPSLLWYDLRRVWVSD